VSADIEALTFVVRGPAWSAIRRALPVVADFALPATNVATRNEFTDTGSVCAERIRIRTTVDALSGIPIVVLAMAIALEIASLSKHAEKRFARGTRCLASQRAHHAATQRKGVAWRGCALAGGCNRASEPGIQGAGIDVLAEIAAPGAFLRGLHGHDYATNTADRSVRRDHLVNPAVLTDDQRILGLAIAHDDG
jgi:hypothetical protein